jgi:glutathione S-transferase
VTHGLDAPLVKDALRHHQKLFAMMEEALKSGPYLAGADWSLADAAATPYIWRLEKLKLSRLWEGRRGIADWYDRVRARPSFKTAVEDWITPADNERYASQPDPWAKVSALIRAA